MLREHDFLFILGDLFEYWIGDDANQFHLVTKALEKLNAKIFFIPGNRDFLIGSDFLVRTNMTLLKDPTLILLGNKRTLVLHGDTLCTDDKEYQEFIHQKKVLLENVKNNHKELLKQLTEMDLPNLTGVLNKKFAQVESAQHKCDICNVFIGKNAKALAAHKRKCSKDFDQRVDGF